MGVIGSIKILFRLRKKKEIDLLIVSIDNIFYDLFFTIFSKLILRKKVFFISDEYTTALRKNKYYYKMFPFLMSVNQKYAIFFLMG